MNPVMNRDLRQFIDDLNDGHYDKASGEYIAKHFGNELLRLARSCDYDITDEKPDDYGEEPYDLDLYELLTRTK